MRQNSNNRRKPQKKNQLGFIFWIMLILFIITLFTIRQKTIKSVIETTGFSDVLSRSINKESDKDKKVDIRRITETKKEEKHTKSEEKLPENTEKQKAIAIQELLDGLSDEEKKALIKKAAVINVEKNTNSTEEKPAAAVVAAAAAAGEKYSANIKYKMRDSILYFVVIKEDGSIGLQKTSRNIRYIDSPLTSTITALLAGANSSEINNNYISLIPENTKLNKIWVSDGIAYMDFNENFLFNSFGREGYDGQLKQIIYSATEFPTVKQVQILIDGKTKSYLGLEGIYIGKPIDRNSFK
jgi:spore germination protein GerM